jgi:hypothetical protein
VVVGCNVPLRLWGEVSNEAVEAFTSICCLSVKVFFPVLNELTEVGFDEMVHGDWRECSVVLCGC